MPSCEARFKASRFVFTPGGASSITRTPVPWSCSHKTWLRSGRTPWWRSKWEARYRRKGQSRRYVDQHGVLARFQMRQKRDRHSTPRSSSDGIAVAKTKARRMPALLMTTFRSGCFASTSAAACSMLVALAVSIATEFTASSASRRRPPRMTWLPSLWNASASPCPMPEVPSLQPDRKRARKESRHPKDLYLPNRECPNGE